MKRLLEIEVPEGDFCYGYLNDRNKEYDIKGYCEHFDNHGGHETCKFFDNVSWKTDDGPKKDKECIAMRAE